MMTTLGGETAETDQPSAPAIGDEETRLQENPGDRAGAKSDDEDGDEEDTVEVVGPLRFYRLPSMSMAGLKSVLKMEAAIGLVLSLSILFSFTIVGSNHAASNMPLAAMTKAAIALAALSDLTSMLNVLFAMLMFFSFGKPRTLDKTYASPARLAVAKFCAAGISVATALLTCFFAKMSPDSETGLGLLAFTCGVITVPIYLTFFIMEAFALLWRPRMLEANGMVPNLDEDVDICCAPV
jgi:hypothetical protein